MTINGLSGNDGVNLMKALIEEVESNSGYAEQKNVRTVEHQSEYGIMLVVIVRRQDGKTSEWYIGAQ